MNLTQRIVADYARTKAKVASSSGPLRASILRDVEIDEPRDLQAAVLAAAVLTGVYNVSSADAVEALVNTPRLRSLRLKPKEHPTA